MDYWDSLTSVSGRRQILVVDDEMVNRAMLGAILEKDYDVELASDGEEALQQINTLRDTLSLILLDLILPDMHGFDILKELKTDPELSRIPVIVMTSDTASEVESLTRGATDFIPKPYPEPDVVLARVKRTVELFEDRNIIRLTERDQLTGLYNREYFYRYAEQLDQYHKEVPMDAIVIDVNRFHMINERYGKAYGDEFLRQVGERIRNLVRDTGGIVCRREADTFLVYCPHRTDYDYHDMLEGVSAGLALDGVLDQHIRLRMGVYPNVDKSIDILQRFDRAKMASDSVRNSYSNSVAVYDKQLHEKEIFGEQLLEDFREAIAGRQFEVYYQPKYDVRLDHPVLSSAEALVRWKHPVHGMISPGIFIPLFEKNGLIQEIDNYVWREAAAQMKEWKARLGRSIPVSVNVSRVDMYDPAMVDNLKKLVEEYGLSTQELLLEITESAYTQDSEQIIQTVNRLRNLGFRIEMDDFGTGYSSLNMISTLPIDALKLDMMFIRNAFTKKKDTRIIEVIIDIADYLSVPVIAEGVETADQVKALKEMGCRIIQGYHFSRPVPASEFETFLTKNPDTEASPEPEEHSGEAAGEEAEELQNEIAMAAMNEEFSAISHIDQVEKPAEEGQRIHLRTASFVFVTAAVLMALALFLANVGVNRGHRENDQANKRFIRAQQAAVTLESASDYLTNSVRCFTVTGDIRYLKDFYEEVETTRTRDAAVSDMEEMLEGNESDAYTHLAEALKLSNELVKAEHMAMKYIVEAGDYDPGDIPEEISRIRLEPGEQALSPEEKKEKAVELVFGDEYMEYKAKIKESTALCTEDLIAGFEQELQASGRRMNRLLVIQTVLTIMLFAIVLAMVIFISFWVRKPLTRMVTLMKEKKTVPPSGAEELRFVTRTYNEIFEENQKTFERLTFESMHDALTGLYNRNAYQILSPDMDMRHCALLIVDVDKFKEVNDTYGHDIGDRILKRVADILQKSFRSVDKIFRIGGDEFVVVMTRTNSSMREIILAKIEQANTMLQNPADDLPPVSISVGAAMGDRKNPQGDILKDADTALYRVKESGRCGCLIY